MPVYPRAIGIEIRRGVVTQATDVNGLIAVVFSAAFAATPMITVQLENDVDYYPVITAKNAAGFTVKILKTAHAHTQGNTGGAGSHNHLISLTTGAGSAHSHTQGVTGGPSATISPDMIGTYSTRYAALTSGGSPDQAFHAISNISSALAIPTSTHYHTNPNTANESAHTHDYIGNSDTEAAHAHTNPNTNSANAGNTLASTGVTFSYIAVEP